MNAFTQAHATVPDGMFTACYRAYLADLEFVTQDQEEPRPRPESNKSASIEPRVLKTNDAATYLGVSAWKLRNLVQSSEISYIPGDGTSPWLFDKRDLDGWIENRKRRL